MCRKRRQCPAGAAEDQRLGNAGRCDGAGVMQLVDRIREDDLLTLDPQLKRHYIPLGDRFDNTPFELGPYGSSIVVAGTSGGGKTTLTAAFMEVLLQHGYQFCMVDPEGDYLEMQGDRGYRRRTSASVYRSADAIAGTTPAKRYCLYTGPVYD